MRIIQVVESLDLGGVERIAIQLAAAGRARGHDCSIYSIFRAGAQASVAVERGIHLRCFNKKSGPSVEEFDRSRPGNAYGPAGCCPHP